MLEHIPGLHVKLESLDGQQRCCRGEMVSYLVKLDGAIASAYVLHLRTVLIDW